MKSAAVLAGIAGLAFTGAASAQFTRPYDPANWTLTTTGDGSVDTSLAPASITVIGNNNSIGGDTDYTIPSGGAGNFAFDWSYTSPDSGTYDSAYYLVNGVATFLAANNSQGFGSISVPVSSGDIIGFRVNSADGGFGAGSLTISNFSAPIPSPGSLALLGMGGILAARRRRS